MEQPKVSVVILTKDHPDLLYNCIDQLCTKTMYKNFEIVVVDTGSSETVLKSQKEWIDNFNRCAVSLHTQNMYNFGVNNNYAVKELVDKDSKYILFLNDDAEAVNDIITILVSFAEWTPNVGTVAAQLRGKDERIQGMGYFVDEYENGRLNVRQHGYNQLDPLYYSREFHISTNAAVAMLISKDLFEQVGGFSDIYEEDYSDLELGLKCVLEGKNNYCLGYAIVIHYDRQTRGITEDGKARALIDMQTKLLPFIDFYREDLRAVSGTIHKKDRSIKPGDWNLGNSNKIESDFINPAGEIYIDPFSANNLQIQMEFEQRYGLASNDGKLHVLMVGHKDGCGWARIDNPAYMINKVAKDMVAFPTSVLTPELLNWAHIFVWQVPVPGRMNKVRDFLKHFDIPQIFEIDDDYIHLDKFNLARATTDPDSVLEWIRECGTITVTRDTLGKFYHRKCGHEDLNYAVTPNCINFDKFPETKYESNNDGVIRLGWMGGCTHFSDLELIAPVIKELKQKYGDKLEICLFGWDGQLKPPFFVRKSVFADIPITHINFVDVYKYYNKLAELKFDICFIPLADIPFNNIGKSPIKFIEAAAARYPCVVSDSPVFNFIEHGKTGLKAKTLDDWREQLTKAIEDVDLRYKLSDNAYELVYDDFNLESQISKWMFLYREVALQKYNCIKDEAAVKDLDITDI